MSIWKKIPEGAEVIMTGGMTEEVLFPLDTDPDFIVRGYVVIDGEKIKADIGLVEWVSGLWQEFHGVEPKLYREVRHET